MMMEALVWRAQSLEQDLFTTFALVTIPLLVFESSLAEYCAVQACFLSEQTELPRIMVVGPFNAKAIGGAGTTGPHAKLVSEKFETL